MGLTPEEIVQMTERIFADVGEFKSLLQDRKRLEWMVENEAFVEKRAHGYDVTYGIEDNEKTLAVKTDDFRDALDEAMKPVGE